MEKILLRVYNSKKIKLSLRIISAVSVITGVLTYCALLFLSFYSSVPEGLSMLCSAAIPFFFVGFIRKKINAPRPYELYQFYEEKPKEREGRSFPSRHAYSVFAISTLAGYYSIPLALAVGTLGICLSVSRVLLGIHFPRDVIAGAALGLASGALGIALLFLNLPV